MKQILFALPLLILVACATDMTKPMRHPDGDHAAAYDDEVVAQACKERGWNDRATPDQQKVIDDIFAARAHRMQHAFWHAVRGGLPAKDQTILVSSFGGDWNNPHPLCPPPANNPDDRTYNPVGEDFLYMHHQMLQMLRTVLTVYGQKCITPWTKIPDPAQWPLSGKLAGPKAPEALAVLQQWDSFIQNPEWLRKVSLSQLGWALEFTIHNNLHMRYTSDRPATPFRASKPEDDGATLAMNGVFPPDWKFDDPRYNWLADPYGAAVNPVFWKIHGYVDNALTLWLKANGKTRISDECGGERTCYQWRGYWTGNTPAIATESKGVPAQAGMKASAAPPAGISDFNRRRLAHQRLGSLTDADFPKKGLPKAGAPQDLLDVAKARVCP
jgi:hypothetical protein